MMRCFIMYLLGLFICVNTTIASTIKKQDIIRGTLNLSNVDFYSSGIQEIGGEAIFYWNEFLNERDILSKKGDSSLISISTSWNNQKKAYKQYPTKGFGTYYFKIIIPQKYIGQQFIFRPDHFIAYSSEIYINKKLVSNNGSVGNSVNDYNYKPSRNTIINPFLAENDTLNVVIKVANYSHFRGGIFQKIKFGLAQDMIQQRENAVSGDLVIIISLLVMFFYHILLFFMSRRDKTALFFSITSLVFAIDLSLQDTMRFFYFFPNIGFTSMSLIHLSIPYLIPSSFMFFLHALFPKDVSKKLRNLTGIVSIILVILTLVNNSNLYSAIVKPHYIYALFLILYVYYVSIRVVVKKRESSTLFLIAFLIFSICAVNDILFMFEVIYTKNLISTGLIVFIFLLSILQGKRFTEMYIRNIKLSDKLKILNTELEIEVDNRTFELKKSLQELEKLNEFKEDMTKMMIHDLKTPLNSIINSRILSDEKTRNILVQQSSYRMLNLINNSLDVYRYENNEIELFKEEYNLYDLLSIVKEEISFSIDQKSISIEIHEDLNKNVLIDKEIIRRVLANILSNAIKFSPNEGSIKLTLEELPNKTVKICISNQGPSIPKEEQKTIFEKFKGVRSEDNYNSHGLGLTFCKLAVEAHNGDIGVVSEEGEDVIFWFTLPGSLIEKELINRVSNTRRQNAILKTEDVKEIKAVLQKLKKLDVYEISEINKLLKSIEIDNSRINKWKSEIDKAVYAGNSSQYIRLLENKI